MARASHRFHGAYRPTAHGDALRHASKAKAQQGYMDALNKAVCDFCGTSLGLVHTEGKMWDIRDPHWIYGLQVLCEPCTVAMEGRLAAGGVVEAVDIWGFGG